MSKHTRRKLSQVIQATGNYPIFAEPVTREQSRQRHVGNWVRRKKYSLILTLLVAVYIAILTIVTFMRYYTFRTYVDLGIFNQAFWTTLHGKLFYETPDLLIIPSGSFLGTHFSLFIFMLLPFYSMHPAPETLLFIQTVFVGLGAVPIYLVSSRVLNDNRIALAMGAIYLTTPAIHSLNMYDFHLEAFLPFFLGMLFYSLQVEKWKLFALFTGLSLITIEFAPVMVFAICASYLLSRWKQLRTIIFQPRKLLERANLSVSFAMVTMLLAPVVFYVSLIASGYFAGTNGSAQSALGGFFPTVSQWLAGPNYLKITFWIMILGNLLFLPLFVPSKLVMILPWMMVTILTTTGAFAEIGYQHAGAFVAPYLILATIYAISKARFRRRIRILLPTILLLCIVATPLNPLVQPLLPGPGIAYEDGLPIVTPHTLLLDRVMSIIPSEGSILTQNNLFSHVSGRPDAYVYLPNDTVQPTFILGDNTSSWYSVATVPPLKWQTYAVSGIEPISTVVKQVLSSGNYGIVANLDGIILLEKNYKGPPLMSQ